MTLIEASAGKAEFTLFTVLSRSPDPSVARDLRQRMLNANVKIYEGTSIPFKRGGVLIAAWRLRKLIMASNPDVIHVHTEIPELTLAIALLGLGRERHTKVLRTVHNSRLWISWEGIGQWVTKRLQLATVAGVSLAALEADAEWRRSARLQPAKTTEPVLIYNGVLLPKRRKSLQEGSTSCVEIPRLVFAGRFERQKGVDLLPAILRRASASSKAQAEIVLIGGGSLKAMVLADLESEPLAWPISFLDPLPNLRDHLADYDLLLMPSRFEGLGLIAIEAALAGVPVVAFSAPGLDEILAQIGGLSAPIGDVDAFAERICDFLDDPVLYRTHTATLIGGLKEQFAISSMERKYMKIFQAMGRP